jgi:hypothetical protein
MIDDEWCDNNNNIRLLMVDTYIVCNSGDIIVLWR